MGVAEQQIDDFRMIKLERGYKLRSLLRADTVRPHRASVKFLQQELSCSFDGPTLVAMIRTYQPPLWIHGHMHSSFDYRIGLIRVVCNPRGYLPDELNPKFVPLLVVEV